MPILFNRDKKTSRLEGYPSVRTILEGRDSQIRDLQNLSEMSFAQIFDDRIKGGKE